MMNSKMMAAGGMAKKGMAAGGAATKGTHKMPGGATMKDADMKNMKTGGMAMTMKDGKKVPAFAADGKGKMATGGMAKKGYAAGGVVKSKVRGAGIAIKGTRPAKKM
jgi:hypothetical protein